jgi:hypothetical protein
VQIAAEHAEAVGECTGMRVEKRFLLDRIALHSGGVSPRNIECAAAVIADFADSGLAVGDGTAVSTGKTADAIVVEFLVERCVGLADAFVEDGAEGGHGAAVILAPASGLRLPAFGLERQTSDLRPLT